MPEPTDTIIEVCAHYARMLMLPKSVGQVYGVLFASERPLCFDEVVERLGISKGGASQSLRFLRDYKAVRVVSVEGDRRDFYVPEMGLRRVISGVFRDRLEPGLREGRAMVENLPKEIPDSPVLTQRIESLRTWNRKVRLPVAVLEQLIGKR